MIQNMPTISFDIKEGIETTFGYEYSDKYFVTTPAYKRNQLAVYDENKNMMIAQFESSGYITSFSYLH
jgi:hypothetical protein